MSVRYRPVQWNRNKCVYDAVLLAVVAAYLWLFIDLGPLLVESARRTDAPILRMRAFGSCAFLMLTAILCIGPLARLDRRFLPLLYNRRHFGVLTFFVALGHANFVLGWYHSYGVASPYASLLASNTAFASFVGFPFEVLGLLALVILFALMATSHDFWLRFLTPPVWKALHMGVYLAYGLIVMHVILGPLQAGTGPVDPLLVGLSLAAVTGLHLAAAWRDRRSLAGGPVADDDGTPWVVAARIDDIPMNRAVTVGLPCGGRAAVFRYGNAISAISNVCAHQNGPLGEGRVIGGLITCPWHGYQYRPRDGCSPPPYTDRVATYRVRRRGDEVLLDPRPLAPGTPTEPIVLPQDAPP